MREMPKKETVYERVAPIHKIVFWIVLLLPMGIAFLSGTTESIGYIISGVIGLILAGGYLNWADPESKLEQSASEKQKALPRANDAYFRRIRDIDALRGLEPIVFENLIANVFRQMGYRVITTPTTGDEGVDLFVEKANRKGVVQCKRYKSTVGQPIVRDLYGAMIHTRADEAYLITTGTITLSAQQWASDKPIHLMDGVALIEWINTVRGQKGAFNVVLVDVGIHKSNVMKAVRGVTNSSLQEAMDMVDSVPNVILRGVTEEFANAAKTKLEAEGAKVQIQTKSG